MSGSFREYKIIAEPMKIFGKVSPQVFLALKASGHFHKDFDEFFESLIVKQLIKEGFMEKPIRKAKKVKEEA